MIRLVMWPMVKPYVPMVIGMALFGRSFTTIALAVLLAMALCWYDPLSFLFRRDHH